MKKFSSLFIALWVALLGVSAYAAETTPARPPIPAKPAFQAGNAPQIAWQKFLGGKENEHLSAFHALSGGGFILLAYSDPAGDKSLVKNWGVKIDDRGNIVGEKWAAETVDSFFTSIDPSSDAGYLLAGSFLSDYGVDKGSLDIRVAKLNSKGERLWEKFLGGSERDFLLSLSATPDGGALILGEAFSTDGQAEGNASPGDLWLIKLSSGGEVQGQTFLKNQSAYFIDAAKAVMDGDIFKIPADTRYPKGLKAYGQKVAAAAQQLCAVLEPHKTDLLIEHLDLVIAPDNKRGYFFSFASWTKNPEKTGGRTLQTWAARLNSEFKPLLQKPLRSGDRYLIWALSAAPDGGFLASGTVSRRGKWIHLEDQPEKPHRGIFLKFNQALEPVGYKVPLSQNQGEFFGLLPLPGGKYLVAGEGSPRLQPSRSKVWILGVDASKEGGSSNHNPKPSKEDKSPAGTGPREYKP